MNTAVNDILGIVSINCIGHIGNMVRQGILMSWYLCGE